VVGSTLIQAAAGASVDSFTAAGISSCVIFIPASSFQPHHLSVIISDFSFELSKRERQLPNYDLVRNQLT
jgi:hypothetical protein